MFAFLERPLYIIYIYCLHTPCEYIDVGKRRFEKTMFGKFGHGFVPSPDVNITV